MEMNLSKRIETLKRFITTTNLELLTGDEISKLFTIYDLLNSESYIPNLNPKRSVQVVNNLSEQIYKILG